MASDQNRPAQRKKLPKQVRFIDLLWSEKNATKKTIKVFDTKDRVYEIRHGETIFLPKQLEYILAMFIFAATFYGGAVGGGKSRGLRWALIYFLLVCAALGFREVVAAIFCETYDLLEDRQIKPARREFPEWLGTFNKAEREFKLHDCYGGGILCFRNLDEPKKYASAEFAAAGFDESTKSTKETYDDIATRVRWKGLAQCPILLASNPGSIGHCLSFGEALTPSGFKDLRDFKIGDPVMTVLPSGEMAESIVEQVHRSHYRGKMMRVKGEGLFVECTPNHKIAKAYGVRKGKNTRNKISERFSLVPFDKLPGQAYLMRSVSWTGHYVEKFTLPVVKDSGRLKQPDELPIDNFAALMGWFLSEGYTLSKAGGGWRFGISQSKTRHRDEIRTLLTQCGFSFKEYKDVFEIHSRKWVSYLAQFGKCRQKFIPQWIKNLPPQQLAALFDALMKGDGHRASKTSGQYYTISKRLADDVAEVAVKLGYIVSVNTRQRYQRRGESYTVSFKMTKSGGSELLTGNHLYDVKTETKRRSNIERFDYDGEVVCIGVPDTHTFIARQNGSIWISGNSWHKRLFVDERSRPMPEYDTDLDIWTKGHCFIPALAKENPFIDKNYYLRLKSIDPKKYQALVLGDWNIFEGQFIHLEKGIHLVHSFDVPFDEWILFRGIDHGFVHPTVCLIAAMDHDGTLWFIDEYSFAGRTPTQNKRYIHDMCMDPRDPSGATQLKFVMTVGDPSMFATDGSVDKNKTPAEIYNLEDDEFGSFFMLPAPGTKGKGARVAGWNALRQGLSYEFEMIEQDGKRVRKITRQPKVRIFEDKCPYLVQSFGNLVHKENGDVEDIEKTTGVYAAGEGDDEAEDARYIYLAAVGNTFKREYAKDEFESAPGRLNVLRDGPNKFANASVFALD